MNRNMARAALSLVLTLVWVMPVIAAETFPIRDGEQGGVLGGFGSRTTRSTPARSRSMCGAVSLHEGRFCQPRLGGDNTSTVSEDGARPPSIKPDARVHRPGHERRRLQALRKTGPGTPTSRA